MTIVLETQEGTEFIIKLSGPNKSEIEKISEPDEKGQTSAREVWADRKLNELKKSLLRMNYTVIYK